MDAAQTSSPGGGSSSPEGQLSPGQKIGGGRYALIKLLGRGGMGVVWLARDERLGESVALKMLPPEIRSDRVALDDLRRETLKSRRLTHPNIIRIHDLYEAEGEAAFISMEFVDGPNLVDLRLAQTDRLFAWEFLKPLIKQLCEALEYAHGEKVIHRDLKPGNVMLDSRGRLKLADFGIAATVSDSISRVSLKQMTSGTPTYMSPQQMEGLMPRISDDVYSLGATLYELLTSRPPFYTGDLVHQVKNVAPQPMEARLADLELANEIPAEVAVMIMACLAKDPAQRPQTALAVAAGIGLTAGLPNAGEVIAAPGFSDPGSSPSSPDDLSVATPPSNRSSPGLMIAVVALLLAGAVAAILFARHKSAVRRVEVAPPTDAPAPPVVLDEPAAKETVTNSPATPGPATAASGWLDESFDPGAGFDSAVRGIVFLPSGRMLAAGNFSLYHGVKRIRLAQINPDGTLFKGIFSSADGSIEDLAVQRDGRIVIVGAFKGVNNGKDIGIGRLNVSLSTDPAFNAPVGADRKVYCVAIQPDGRILLGGDFATFNGVVASRVARLHPKGSLDASFVTGAGADASVRCLVVQPNNDILMAGHFTSVAGVNRNGLVRLKPDGRVDATFDAKLAKGAIEAVALAADGKILIGGRPTAVGGGERTLIARLNPNGALDPTFNPGPVVGTAVWSIRFRADGKILAMGDFSSIGGVKVQSIALLNPDGSVDRDFAENVGVEGTVHRAVFQPDGKLVVIGEFTRAAGQSRNRIARFYSEAPQAGTGPTSAVPVK